MPALRPQVMYGLDPLLPGWRAPGRVSALLASRRPPLWPWSTQSPINTPLSDAAAFEAAGATATAQILAGNPELQWSRWSVSRQVTTTADPLVTVVSLASSDTWSIRIPADAVATAGTDGHMTIIQPDGVTAYEGYAMIQLDGATWQTKYDLLTNDLTTGGITQGRIASNVAQSLGLILAAELAALSIPHAVTLGAPKTALKLAPTSADGLVGGPNSSGAEWVYPANGADNQTNLPYSGANAMGSLYAIPAGVDLSTLGLTPEGLALGRALQRFGAYVLIQANTIAIRADPRCDNAAAGRARSDWQAKLFPLIRRVTNAAPGSIDPTTRLPIVPSPAHSGTPLWSPAPAFIA